MGLKPINQTKLLNFFSSLPLFLIPFLGGNHLSLFYIKIDKFWIETTFVLSLTIAVFIQSRGKDVFRDKTFIYFFAPFAVITMISVFYTWNILSTMNEIGVLVWISGSVYIFINSKNRDVFLKALVLGTALSAICAIAQSKFLFPGLIETSRGGGYSVTACSQTIPFSSFLHHNVFGGFMCFVLPLAFYFGTVQKKWIFMPITVVIVAGVILSTSKNSNGTFFAHCCIFRNLFVEKQGC